MVFLPTFTNQLNVDKYTNYINPFFLVHFGDPKKKNLGLSGTRRDLCHWCCASGRGDDRAGRGTLGIHAGT